MELLPLNLQRTLIVKLAATLNRYTKMLQNQCAGTKSIVGQQFGKQEVLLQIQHY